MCGRQVALGPSPRLQSCIPSVNVCGVPFSRCLQGFTLRTGCRRDSWADDCEYATVPPYRSRCGCGWDEDMP